MRVNELVVEPEREWHIARHGIAVEEVEEIVLGDPLVHRTREGRFRLLGQTEAGRYLAVFLAPRGGGVYALVTARDATESERRLYQEQKRRW